MRHLVMAEMDRDITVMDTQKTSLSQSLYLNANVIYVMYFII